VRVAERNDDRVAAWHAWKFTAALQAAQRCPRPVVLRTVPGHTALQCVASAPRYACGIPAPPTRVTTAHTVAVVSHTGIVPIRDHGGRETAWYLPNDQAAAIPVRLNFLSPCSEIP
jgi:hypothetical protein